MATHGARTKSAGERLGLGLGSAGFVERHGLYSDEQAGAALDVAAQIEELWLRTVRVVLVDQHGIARSKHVSGDGAIAAMRNGATFPAPSTEARVVCLPAPIRRCRL
jgi:hypothetical protein